MQCQDNHMQGKRIKPHIFLEKLREDVLEGPSQVFQGLDKEQSEISGFTDI